MGFRYSSWIYSFWSRTSMVINTTVRQHITNISQLRDKEGDVRFNRLANQLETLLNIQEYQEGQSVNINFQGLTKYSEGKGTVRKNIETLKAYIKANPEIMGDLSKLNTSIPEGHNTSVEILTDFSMGEALVLSYLSVLYPHANEESLLKKIRVLDPNQKAEIGKIILQDHSHHDLMQRPGDIRGQALLISETALAYVRDLNRQRATGRLIHMLETDDIESILRAGYNMNFQINNMHVLSHLTEAWDESFGEYYEKLLNFYLEINEALPEQADRTFIYNLLPLAHQTKMHMSGPVTQLVYLTALRLGLGADHGYKNWVYKILELTREDDFLVHLHDQFEAPDPNSVKELIGRS